MIENFSSEIGKKQNETFRIEKYSISNKNSLNGICIKKETHKRRSMKLSINQQKLFFANQTWKNCKNEQISDEKM